MSNTRSGVVYQRAGHVDRNRWSRCRNPPVTIAGMTGHVPGISGHVGPEYALLQLAQEKSSLYQKVGSYRAVAGHLEQLERQLRSSMPQHVMDMLGQQAASISR